MVEPQMRKGVFGECGKLGGGCEAAATGLTSFVLLSGI